MLQMVLLKRFYGSIVNINQPIVKLLQIVPNITFVEGVPENLNEYIDSKYRNLIVIDDLMSETGNDKCITNLFTKGSHHKNLSMILLLQNLFYNGKESRYISLNAHYIVLFKSPRDNTVITSLAKQMYPGKIKFLQEAFCDATKQPYHYLFLDLKPYTDEQFRVHVPVLCQMKLNMPMLAKYKMLHQSLDLLVLQWL